MIRLSTQIPLSLRLTISDTLVSLQRCFVKRNQSLSWEVNNCAPLIINNNLFLICVLYFPKHSPFWEIYTTLGVLQLRKMPDSPELGVGISPLAMFKVAHCSWKKVHIPWLCAHSFPQLGIFIQSPFAPILSAWISSSPITGIPLLFSALTAHYCSLSLEFPHLSPSLACHSPPTAVACQHPSHLSRPCLSNKPA